MTLNTPRGDVQGMLRRIAREEAVRGAEGLQMQGQRWYGGTRPSYDERLMEPVRKTLEAPCRFEFAVATTPTETCQGETRISLRADSGDQMLSVGVSQHEPGYPTVTIEATGDLERRRLIEGLRWMADEIESQDARWNKPR